MKELSPAETGYATPSMRVTAVPLMTRTHLTLCGAIVEADPDAAAAACVQHLRHTEETILAAVMESTPRMQVDLISM